jgi:Uma2 family endonuclease
MSSVAVREPENVRWLGLPGQDELPCDDGEPLETLFHDVQDALLKDCLSYANRDRPELLVGGNQFIYYSPHQIRKNDFRGPDVFVVLNAKIKKRKSWVMWEEDGRLPDVVIEVTSREEDHLLEDLAHARILHLRSRDGATRGLRARPRKQRVRRAGARRAG